MSEPKTSMEWQEHLEYSRAFVAAFAKKPSPTETPMEAKGEWAEEDQDWYDAITTQEQVAFNWGYRIATLTAQADTEALKTAVEALERIAVNPSAAASIVMARQALDRIKGQVT